MRRVVILGAGGFAREVLDVFEAANGAAPEPVWDVLGYLVEAGFGEAGETILDRPVLGSLDWLTDHCDEVEVIGGVGAPELRQRLVAEARRRGARFCTVVHPRAVLTRWVTVGEGVVITAGCILTNQIRIGDHAHLNLDCTVGHDAVIGDFATLSPGVHVSGRVQVGTGAFVGTGANVIERVRIGSWSVVGAGAVVTQDVPENATAVGVPARVIATRESGWQDGWRRG